MSLNTYRNQIALSAISILMLSGCGSKPLILPTPSPDLMSPPCKISNAANNSDDDLIADIETANCVKELRSDKYRWQLYYKTVINAR